MDIEELKIRLDSLLDEKDEMEGRHKDDCVYFSYNDGFDLGYVKGKINELATIINTIQNAMDEDSEHD